MRFCVIVLFISVATSVYAADKNAFKQLLLDKALDLYNDAQRYMVDNNLEFSPTADYPYWNFLPQYINSFTADTPQFSWTSACFQNNEAVMARTGNTFDIEITSSHPLAENCEDHYMTLAASVVNAATPVATADASATVITKYSVSLPEDVTDAELWDAEKKGLRLLQYPTKSAAETYSNIIKTFELFIPEFTLRIPKTVAEANIDFLSKYVGLNNYAPRDTRENVLPPKNMIHSGDVLYVIRFDGLDPLLAWAMGSTTGHTTTALWIDGELYITESTVADSYWPTDNIQKTPYDDWIKQAIAADFLVVWGPLSDQARSNYNETAAVEFFNSQEGFSYGFQTMLWGWLDTPTDNFPCLPPDFGSNCVQWELLEPLLAYVDRLVNEIGDQMWNAGLAKRLGVEVMRTAEIYQEAGKQGMTTTDVFIIPEDDNWEYNTTRYGEPAVGKAMVCCVYVCNSWKAAGVFGALADSINCGEMTNWDDYVLTVHADTYQQILGSYDLKLNDYSTAAPYAHMREKCESKGPEYAKSEGC